MNETVGSPRSSKGSKRAASMLERTYASNGTNPLAQTFTKSLGLGSKSKGRNSGLGVEPSPRLQQTAGPKVYHKRAAT